MSTTTAQESLYIVTQSPRQEYRSALVHVVVIVSARSKKAAIEKADAKAGTIGGVNASDKCFKKPVAEQVEAGAAYHL